MLSKMESVMQVIGLHIEPYFAEVCVREAKPKKTKSTEASVQALLYLPRQKLGAYLAQCLAKTQEKESLVVISTRYLERLAGYRLGGSTAQIVSKGLEAWAFANPGTTRNSSGTLIPRPLLSAPHLCFGVSEQTAITGAVTASPSDQELEAISEKLTQHKAKRVCVHFRNAHINPQNQNAVAKFFQAKGFEIVLPTAGEPGDEIPRWRLNTLQASLAGTFDDLKQEITAALPESLREKPLHFLTDKGWTTQQPTQLALCGTAQHDLWQDHLQRPYIYLGFEKWCYVSMDRSAHIWKSPWGELRSESAHVQNFLLQPGQLLETVFDLGHLPLDGGFEPGPVSFGRGQKLLLIDLLTEEIQNNPLTNSWVSANGIQKRDDLLRAMERNKTGYSAKRSLLLDRIRERILCQAQWFAGELDQTPIVGPLAHLLNPASATHPLTASLLVDRAQKDLLK